MAAELAGQSGVGVPSHPDLSVRSKTDCAEGEVELIVEMLTYHLLEYLRCGEKQYVLNGSEERVGTREVLP